jgi:hypothetical protein
MIDYHLPCKRELHHRASGLAVTSTSLLIASERHSEIRSFQSRDIAAMLSANVDDMSATRRASPINDYERRLYIAAFP